MGPDGTEAFGAFPEWLSITSEPFEPSTLLKKFLTLATSKGGIQEATDGNQWIDGPATVSHVTSQIHWERRPLEDGTSLVSTLLHSVYRTEMVRPPRHGGTDR